MLLLCLVALASWGPVLDDLTASAPAQTLIAEISGEGLTQDVIAEEVAALNAVMRLPHEVTVAVEPCDEANGFYDLTLRKITICTEFEQHLRDLAR